MSAELLVVFLPGRNYCRAGNTNSADDFPFRQNSSKSQQQQTPGTRKNVNFENRRYGFSSYNCMSAESLVVFLPGRNYCRAGNTNSADDFPFRSKFF